MAESQEPKETGEAQGQDQSGPEPSSGSSGEAGAEPLDEALEQARASVDELRETVEGAGGSGDQAKAAEPGGLELLGDVDLDVVIELGRTEMLVEDVLKLDRGSVVELDKLAGDPVDVRVNGRLVARGEVLVLNDNFCIRISEILANLEDEAELVGMAHGRAARPQTSVASGETAASNSSSEQQGGEGGSGEGGSEGAG